MSDEEVVFTREEVLEARLRDFMDYYEPRGGVSDVPLGPFERAIEVLGGCSRCGGAPLNHKQWCDDPTEAAYDALAVDGGLPEAQEALAAFEQRAREDERALMKEEGRKEGWTPWHPRWRRRG